MKRRESNFENLLKVLRREEPERPVLFELFMNMPLYETVNGRRLDGEKPLDVARFTVEAFHRLGYDYATVHASDFHFPLGERRRENSVSLNEGAVIFDEKSFESYAWPDPNACDYSTLQKIKAYLPDGMKLMVMGPGGVLENVTSLLGYDNLCYMLYEDPELVGRVFDQVGSRLVAYYKNALCFDSVGLISSNDDWGFNTQTFLSPEHMRRYVIPWHKNLAPDACRGAQSARFLTTLKEAGALSVRPTYTSLYPGPRIRRYFEALPSNNSPARARRPGQARRQNRAARRFCHRFDLCTA